MRITISIPKPCHADWQAMTPNVDPSAGKGRHCAQCDHVVADLTRATDAELVALFTSDAKPKCARFDPAQLDRVLGASETPRQAGALPLAAFTSLVAVAAGQQAIAQGGPVIRPTTTLGEPTIERPVDVKPIRMGKMVAEPGPDAAPCQAPLIGDTLARPSEDDILQRFELGNVNINLERIIDRSSFGEPAFVQDSKPPDTLEVCGAVIDHRTGEPIPFAQIWSGDLNAHTTTDAAGKFRFKLARSGERTPMTIEVRSPGYLFEQQVIDPDKPMQRHTLPNSVTAPMTGPIDPHDPMGVTGMVKDANGAQVPGLEVRLRGTAVRVRCDTDGGFFLSVPEQGMGRSLTLDVLDADRVLKSIPLSGHAARCCVPVTLTPEEMPLGPTEECQDVGTIRLRERPMLTGMVAISPEPMRRDTLDRFLRPVKDVLRKQPR